MNRFPPVRCVPCWSNLHASCYSDGVCQCDCAFNIKLGFENLRMKIAKAKRKDET